MSRSKITLSEKIKRYWKDPKKVAARRKNRGKAATEFVRRARKIFQQYKSMARKRSLGFDLDEDWFRAQIKLACTYCGTAANPTNGLDRINNELGYYPDNLTPCCSMCNRMKHTFLVENWLLKIKEIAAHQEKIHRKFQADPETLEELQVA